MRDMMLYLIFFLVSTTCMKVCNGDIPGGRVLEDTSGHFVLHPQSTISTNKFILAEKTEIQTEYPQFKNQTRLPKFAIPRHYDIRLKPDLIALNFSGLVSINIDVVSATKFLVLNSKNLTIDSSSVSFKPNSSSQALKPVKIGSIDEDDVLVIEFGNELPLGGGILNISFQGTINTGADLIGMFRSVYNYNGEEKNMGVTTFEPVGARQCFPCWDEPALKATFTMTLEVPSDVVALSNMPALEEKKNGDTKTVYYQESPIMSTYLVAVAVAKYDYVESRTSDGIHVRCYTQFGKTDQLKFALDVAVKSLDLFSKYFNMSYSLPKMDLISVTDFPVGGMENYGLITIVDRGILVDEKHSSFARKLTAGSVVSHEIAHQWFGNLVTMEWWTHLWLNEGFATWASYMALDTFFPGWNMWSQFLNEKEGGLWMDGLSGSHPVEVEINHADEAKYIFDSISYNKGASLIRMLQTYIGADTFQRAMASYIKTYAHSNAKTEDLWTVIEKESGEPVIQLMSLWTKQKGYPVVSVKIKNHMLEFEQSQFMYSGSAGEGQWVVPLTLSFGSYDKRQNFLLKEKIGTMNVNKSAWIKLNVNQTGFYRVKYDEILEAKLRHAIERQELSPDDRYGVLDDSQALCKSGQLPPSNVLSLMWSLREETENIILSKLLDISTTFVGIVGDAIPERVDDLKKFFISLFEHPGGKLGWDPKSGEDQSVALLRAKFLTVLAQLGHESTLNEATRRFDAFCADQNSSLLLPDYRTAAYVAIMRKATASNKSGYEALLKLYKKLNPILSEESKRILSSLPMSPDPALVLEALNFVLTSENVDAVRSVSREGRETAWKWFQGTYDSIKKKLDESFTTGSFIWGMIRQFSSEEKAKEVESFFSTRMTPAVEVTVKQALEAIRIDARFVQAVKKDAQFPKVLQDLLSSTKSSCPVTPPV